MNTWRLTKSVLLAIDMSWAPPVQLGVPPVMLPPVVASQGTIRYRSCDPPTPWNVVLFRVCSPPYAMMAKFAWTFTVVLFCHDSTQFGVMTATVFEAQPVSMASWVFPAPLVLQLLKETKFVYAEIGTSASQPAGLAQHDCT